MSTFVQGEPAETIEKTMSLSLDEFEKSLARLAPDVAAIRMAPGRYEPPVEVGRVLLSVTELESMLMGGLVNLPRCKVVISFTDMPVEQRSVFLNRFDQAFQRGGG